MDRITYGFLIAAVIFLVGTPAFGEKRDVSRLLGVKAASVATALDDGFRRPWGEESSTAAKMTAETSQFLKNAPTATAVRERLERERAQREVEAKEKERQAVIQNLEFRRNVEDAMQKILSFEPTARSAPAGVFGARSEPDAKGELGEAAGYRGGDGLTGRERLIFSAVGRDYQPPAPAKGVKPLPVAAKPAAEPPKVFSRELPRGLDEVEGPQLTFRPKSDAPVIPKGAPVIDERRRLPSLPDSYEVIPDEEIAERPIQVIGGDPEDNITHLRR